jgi:hypothetical protein
VRISRDVSLGAQWRCYTGKDEDGGGAHPAWRMRANRPVFWDERLGQSEHSDHSALEYESFRPGVTNDVEPLHFQRWLSRRLFLRRKLASIPPTYEVSRNDLIPAETSFHAR